MAIVGSSIWREVNTRRGAIIAGVLAAIVALAVAVLLFWPLKPPYPPSPVIAGVTFDWTMHKRAAPGSGDWGITWADDDHQYTAWGNGGGFGGTNSDGRSWLGIARIEGGKDDYRGINVWGGKDPESPAQFGGKAYSLLSLNKKLYMWRCGDKDGATAFDFQQLHESGDYGRTWRPSGVEFTQSDFAPPDHGFFCPAFLQFGKAYAGARDGYVYIYAADLQDPSLFDVQKSGKITLMRVGKDDLNVEDAYEYFAGVDETGAALWTDSPADREPVLEDPNGVTMHLAVAYDRGLNRYLLLTEHEWSGHGNIGIFDAPEPWGPWTTVLYDSSFGDGSIEDNTMMWVIPTKWISSDGRQFVMIFTGIDKNDSWNTVEGSFILPSPQAK